jgi:hypothetical protein
MEEMTTFSVTIPVVHGQKLTRIAEQLGMSAEDLIHASRDTR